MKLSRAGAAVSFIGGLTIGVGVAGFFAGPPQAAVTDLRLSPLPVHVVETVPIRAEELRGTWTGTFGRAREHCTIEIERVKGNWFAGTLRKEGAVISFEGRVDEHGRTLIFQETKVRKLGPHMSKWSLGTNSGSFSPDGRTLTGRGTDEWGSYGWDATRE